MKGEQYSSRLNGWVGLIDTYVSTSTHTYLTGHLIGEGPLPCKGVYVVES